MATETGFLLYPERGGGGGGHAYSGKCLFDDIILGGGCLFGGESRLLPQVNVDGAREI